MPRSIFDDLLPWALYGGIGYLVLRRGPSGTSLFDEFTQSIGKGVGQGIGVPNPFSGSAPTTASEGGASPAGQPDQFNFNSDQSNVYFHTAGGNFDGHIGLGHVGPGGTFVLAVKVRNGGILNLGQSDWVTIFQTNLTVGNDSDWAGYGEDLNVPFGQVPNLPNLNISVDVLAELWGAVDGVRYASVEKQAIWDAL